MLEIDIYHDESKEGGYWPGLLFVRSQRVRICWGLLETVRERTRWVNLVELGARGGQDVDS